MGSERCKHVTSASKQVVVAIGASVAAGLVASGEGRRGPTIGRRGSEPGVREVALYPD